ncbi:MAG: hypothetical protein GKR91_08240 [Pseudomonadales bacterium]|nr:hypothetical protein [Pseudomonadales bacterium]
MKHPNLAIKLQLLYSLQVNSKIKNHSDLARELDVSRQAVSRWCRGTTTTHGNCIPHYQVAPIAKLFLIEVSWLSLEIEQFETKVRDRLEQSNSDLSKSAIEISNSTMPITSLELFGRDNELELLNYYWQQSESNVVQLIAFGGVGKSSLVNRWLSDLNKSEYKVAERVYAWSFYWQGESSELKSSGDLFIEHALEWFGDEEPASGTPWAKASRLAKLIRSKKTLLVLDGLEPMQLGPGPKQGQIENPAISCLVRELSEENTGLCLITSRLEVRDLENYADGRIGTIDLGHLSKEASASYLQSLGVSGEISELETAGELYEGHALSLSLFGGYLSVVHGGSINSYKSIESLFGESTLDSHAKNVLSAYLKYFEDSPALKILFLLSLLDRAIELSELQSIANFADIKGLTTELNQLTKAKWRFSIKQLHDSRLVSVEKVRNELVLDCHPIVRDFSIEYQRSNNISDWIKGNDLLFGYFNSVTSDFPTSMQELEPLYRAVRYGANAGRIEEAFHIYFEKIKRKQFSMFTEGSHYADQACIKAFFKKEWDEPLPSLPGEAKGYLLSSAAANLIYLGDIYTAIDPSLKSIEWYVQNGKFLEAASAAGPLMSMLIMAGEMSRALTLEQEMSAIINSSENKVIQGMAANFSGYAQHLKGESENAFEYFERSEAVLLSSNPVSPAPFPTISSYYCKYLLDNGDVKGALNRALKTFAWRHLESWQVAIDTTSLLASDILVLGLIFLESGDKINAKKYLDRQIELLKTADEWLYLPTGLSSRARFHTAVENFQEALKDLDEAISISQITGAKFGEWEAYLGMAQLRLKQENYELSNEYLGKALALPNMEMYRFRDKEIAELRETLAVHLPNTAKSERMPGESLH